MPGILGFIGRNNVSASAPIIQEMLGSMRHHDFCTSRIASFPDLGLELGWLSAPKPFDDVSAWNDQKDVFLLFRGKHFSDEPIKASRNRGEADSGSAAAHWLRLYEQFGPSLFTKLNGFFSGVLVDKREGKIFVFNDRFGLNRVYYHQTVDGFYFSSEAKALLKVLPHLRQLDLESLGEFFSCGCVLQNRTLFRNISLLPPASAWIFKEKQLVEKYFYFKPSMWEDQPRLSTESYHESLRDIFPNILKRYSRHAVGVGMSLTGGLDGRLIMAWSRAEPGAMPCYTFGSCYRETVDVRIARRVAHSCHQPHQVISVGDEFIRSFAELAEKTVRVSDGGMDVSGAVEIYVNRLARQIAPVRLTGNYGSEILRSNVAFRPYAISEHLFDADLVQAARQAATTYAEEARGNQRSFIAFKQVPWHHFARSAVEKSQLTVHSPYLDNDLVALAFQAPESKESNFNTCLRLIAEGNSRLSQIPTDRAHIYTANKILNRLRRSKEQFLAKTEYAYDYGMPHWLARVDSLFAPLQLERLCLGRQKFCHFRVWYRNGLAPYVKEILLDPRSLCRPYLKRRAVERMVTHHLAGKRNFTTDIHKLLTIELMQRLLIE